MSKEIAVRLQKIENLLTDLKAVASKPLDLAEAAEYLGISKSHLYQKTSRREITHYKPEGKKIYFRREDLDVYLLRNRRETGEEIEMQTASRLVHRPTSKMGRTRTAEARA